MKHLLLVVSFIVAGFSSIAQNCEAFFTYSIGENGQVEINNESVWGNEMAMFNWYIDGDLEIAPPNPTFNLAPGDYDFCLEIVTTSGCIDNYCTQVIVPAACDGVVFSFESIINSGTLIELAWLLEDAEGVDLDEGLLELILGGPNANIDLCLPDGCYYLTLEGPLDFGIDVIIFLATLDELDLEPFEVDYNGNSLSVGFSINSNCQVEECPEEMWHGPAELCGCYAFEIGSFGESVEVLWDFGDGTSQEGGHFADHCYETNGEYIVTANYSSDDCSEATFETLVVVDCFGQCELDVEYEINDCEGYAVFEASNFPDGATINWFVDNIGEVFESGVTTFDVAMEPGGHFVCASYESVQCAETVWWCYDFVIEDCTPCPESIAWGPQDECGNTIFWIPGLPELTPGIEWTFGDEATYESSYAVTEYWFESNGTFEVCASFETPECPQGVTLCAEVVIDCYDEACPIEFYMSEQIGCGCYEFEIGSSTDGASIVWDFGDGTTMESGHFTQHCYETDGQYVITALYNSPTCENQLYTLGEADVNCEVGPCDLEIDLTAIECGWMMFEASGFPEGTTIWWEVDGVFTQESGTLFDVEFDDYEVHVVCAVFETPECPQGSWACMEVEAVECDNGCPTDIYMGEQDECGCYEFEIGSFVEGENVLWEFGDGTTYEGGHYVDYCYEQDGEYIVTATYNSPTCQNQIYTLGVANVNCVIEPCDLSMEVVEAECGWYYFEAYDYPAETTIWWEIDDEWLNVTGGGFEYEFEEGGLHTVCAFFETPECPQGTWSCEEIYVELCNDCPGTMYVGEANDCGCFEFEVGNFQEGEEVEWDFGDGTTETGGHYITHCYEEPDGEFIVTALFTSELCPDGVMLTGIAEFECETCTEVGFAFDSDVLNGGPLYVSWLISDDEDNTIESGTCQYTADSQWCDLSLCLEDGCYEVLLDSEGGSSAEIWDNFFSAAFIAEEAIEFVSGPEINDLNQMVYSFGVNSECEVGIEAIHASDIVVFPNPASTSLTITGLEEFDNPIVQLFDAKGRLVFSDQISGDFETIFLSSNFQGIYQLVIASDDQWISKKVQVIK